MQDQKSLSERFAEFRPTKGQWAASCAACIGATIILGFTVGGWVTGGTARSMAETATRDARAELVASICVANFMTAPDAAAELATLKDTNRWQRDSFITDGGWITLAALDDETVPGAARLCANRLADMEIPVSAPEPTLAPPEDEVVDG